MHPRHSCSPAQWTAATGLALAALILAAILMVAVQQYGDSLPLYPAQCRPLWDLGFTVVPQITSAAWWVLPDVWILASYGAFAVVLVGWLPRPQLIFRRFCWVMAINFTLRALSVGVTRYPLLQSDQTPFAPANPWWGALQVLFGGKRTASDMMFSGHTTGWITIALFVSRYARSPRIHAPMLGAMFWLGSVLGIVSLLAVQGHYTADVVVAIVVARFTFNEYHLRLDSEYPLFFVPGLMLRARSPVRIVLPARLRDSSAQELRVDSDPDAPLQLAPAVTAHAAIPAAKGVEGSWWARIALTHGYLGGNARQQAHRLARWLDGE